MNMLPFLKNKKTPRVATEPREEKLINASADDHLNEHMMNEFMDAVESKDHQKFRSSLEALLSNLFEEHEELEDAT